MNCARFTCILADRLITGFMQAADLHEKWKVVGHIHILTVHYKEGEEVTIERAGKLIEHVIEAIKRSNSIPVFVHLTEIETDDGLLFNKRLKIPYYRNPEVKAVSTGDKWYLLDHFITHKLGLTLPSLDNKPISEDGAEEKAGKRQGVGRREYRRKKDRKRDSPGGEGNKGESAKGQGNPSG